MERNNLFFLIAVIVGIGVTYVAVDQAYSTGKVVSSSSCIDSDGGLNYDQSGFVTYRNSNYKDYCSGNAIIERYCTPLNKLSSKRYKCPTTCYNGECGATACENDCNAGARECTGAAATPAYVVCGNYDKDPCLEWSNLEYCPGAYTCEAGYCVAL